ncbi:hypothetical protein TIFTF001_029875 [Ficus carica]|uniref:Uncharacterized protein n=1 Tax=Ficus carica TaxID=3494 RepID=A0AA88DS81_FICCA|nr:hypothetical protein TIFTF001_029875 [Ficus carica]
MVGDGEERERESVWATQGEREKPWVAWATARRERENPCGRPKEREKPWVAWATARRERGRPWARPKERERERKICLASARRERERKLREWREIAKSEIEN